MPVSVSLFVCVYVCVCVVCVCVCVCSVCVAVCVYVGVCMYVCYSKEPLQGRDKDKVSITDQHHLNKLLREIQEVLRSSNA